MSGGSATPRAAKVRLNIAISLSGAHAGRENSRLAPAEKCSPASTRRSGRGGAPCHAQPLQWQHGAQKEGRGGEEAAVLVPAQDRGLRARRGRVRQRGVGRHLGQAGGRRDAELPPDDRQAGEPEEFGRRRRQHAAHAPARAEPALQPALPLLEGPDLHVHRVHPDRRQPVQGAHVLRRPGDGVVPRQVDRRAAAAPLRDGRPRVPLDEGAAVAAAAAQFVGAIPPRSHARLRTPRLRRSTAARSRSSSRASRARARPSRPRS